MEAIKKYFELFPNTKDESQWHLWSPVAENGDSLINSIFYEGKSVEEVQLFDKTGKKKELAKETPKLTFHVQVFGIQMDYTITGSGIPLVSKQLGELFEQLAPGQVQRIPVKVEHYPGEYEILNVINLVDCFDYQKSKYFLCTQDGDRRYGKPSMVMKLKVDANKIGENDEVFRIKDWIPSVIVSERLKIALEESGFTNMTFTRV